MISTGIQTTIKNIIPNTYFVMGDEEIRVPYCVHKEMETEQRGKAGVLGYQYDCEVLIIDDSPDDIETNKESIISALEALGGTTVSSTSVMSVQYEGDEPGFDVESRLYTNFLRFTIITNNR